MNTNPWRVPDRRNLLVMKTFRIDPQIYQAAKELASMESKRYGVLIGTMTILTDLATRNGNRFVAHRAWITQRAKELKGGADAHSTENSEGE